MTNSGPTWQTQAWNPPNVLPVFDRMVWQAELRTAVVVTGFVTMLGSVVGIVWHAVAPRVDIIPLATRGSEAALKPLIGADVWLGVVGAAAAVVCVAMLALVNPDAMDGPGASIGLAIGGVLGMLVAARVGHLLGRHDLFDTLRTAYSHPTASVTQQLQTYVRPYDFGVRAQGVLLTWPVVALVLNGLIVGIRSANQAPPARPSAYPGSS
jgi:hypothetical protein